MIVELVEVQDCVGVVIGDFFVGEEVLVLLVMCLQVLDDVVQQVQMVCQLDEQLEGLCGMVFDLDMLFELMVGLKVDDVIVCICVVELILVLYGCFNQVCVCVDQCCRLFGLVEVVVQFVVQFVLFLQLIISVLVLFIDFECVDEQLLCLLVQLEELESQFGEYEQFFGDILSKCEELVEVFEMYKQVLLDDCQCKVCLVLDVVNWIFDGLVRCIECFVIVDEFNVFFVGDLLIFKLCELVECLCMLYDNVKVDDIEVWLKGVCDQVVCQLCDCSDLYEVGGNVVWFGLCYCFSVNMQVLDLILLLCGDVLVIYLIGIDFLEILYDLELDVFKLFWLVIFDLELFMLYCGEYLVGSLLLVVQEGCDGFDLVVLQYDVVNLEVLDQCVCVFVVLCYCEGYECGIYDYDVVLILCVLLFLQ